MCSKEPQWESKCRKVTLTWAELVDWTKHDFRLCDEKRNPENSWIYYDYNHFPETFNQHSKSHLLNSFNWAKLGFPEKNAESSTFWAGTKGSYTPCHFDTYSCNLVCQVFGRSVSYW